MTQTADELWGPVLAEVGQRPTMDAPVVKASKPTKPTKPAIPTPQVRTFEAGPPVTLVLPYPISANDYWRSRVLPGTQRAVTYVTHEARNYKEGVGWAAVAAGVRKPYPWRVMLELRLYPHRPQDWAKRMRDDPLAWDDTVQCIDLGNAEKVLSDAMNGIVFTDDKMIWRMVKDRMLPDENGKRVEVTVTPLRPIAPDGSLL